jgi:DNA repair ATPase RecN
MSETFTQVVVGLLSGIGVVVVGWLTARRKTMAETENVQILAAHTAVEVVNKAMLQLRSEVKELRMRVEELETEASRLRRLLSLARSYIADLTAEMRRHGIEPPEPPPELNMPARGILGD